MTSSKPTLYLPIEVAARELDARILLAHRAIAAGYRVVIGQQWLIIANMGRLVPGVVFFKGLNKIQKNWMIHTRRFGHRIAAIDEEVTAIAAPDFVVKEVGPGALDCIDAMFMQGPNQHAVYSERFPEHAARYKVTGNPRWDLLRPEFQGFFTEEAARIREAYGDFILLNTNYGYVNSHWGSPKQYIQVCVNVGYVDPRDPADVEWLKGQYEFEKAGFFAFRALALSLRDRYPRHKIVLRPHPAENLANWQKAFKNHPEILVLSEGSAIPWIVAADALIHNTCTTGIEGALLCRPTIAYCPDTNWCESIFISNQVTPRADSFDALAGMLDRALDDPRAFVADSTARFAPAMARHFAGVGGDALATDAIFDQIRSLSDTLDTPRTPSALRPGSTMGQRPRDEYQTKKISFTEESFRARFDEIANAMERPLDYTTELLGDSVLAMEARD